MKPHRLGWISGSLAALGSFALCVRADVIQGVVRSSVDSAGLAQVRVALDSTHYTLTALDGSYTLNTEATAIRGESSAPRIEVAWDSQRGLLSWSRGPEEVASVVVRDARGLVAARSAPGCCADARFSVASLPRGLYFATLKTRRGAVETLRILHLHPRASGAAASFAREDSRGGGLSKASAAQAAEATQAVDTLTFVKAGYTPVTRVVSGSQAGVDVEMRPASRIRYVFVVAMENTDAASIYGNRTNAPYINDSLLPNYANGSRFGDELPLSIVSEPHYIWMEAGTNAFSDHTFTDDSDPSATISTGSTAHLASQIRLSGNGSDWMAYQEDINSATGACPVATSGFYAAKHDPFVFFRDVAGNPPSKNNAYCAAHHKPLTALAADLSGGTVKAYNFITPNQCHDMHGQSGCPSGNIVRAGDDWLRANLPPIIDFVNANSGVIFVTWDEGSATSQMAFLVVGPGVRKGYTSDSTYNHGSMLKSVENILQLPVLPTVSGTNDFSDFFLPGNYP